MLLGELPEAAARANPDGTAVVFDGRKMTWKEVETSVCRVANGLGKLGIRKGDRVAIMLPNIPEFVFSFFAIQRLGAVCVPFNTMYKGGEVMHILRDSGARAVIALSNFAPLINEILHDLPALEHIILTGERSVVFADPESTVFVHLVAPKSRFASADEAYRKVGAALHDALRMLGVKDAWYKHRGSIRSKGRKMAGFVVQEAEDQYAAISVVFAGDFSVEEFISVVWVPQEIRDKVMEPLISVAEAIGRRPSFEEIRSAVSLAFEKEFGVRLESGSFARDEQFGYEKLRSLMGRR